MESSNAAAEYKADAVVLVLAVAPSVAGAGVGWAVTQLVSERRPHHRQHVPVMGCGCVEP